MRSPRTVATMAGAVLAASLLATLPTAAAVPAWPADASPPAGVGSVAHTTAPPPVLSEVSLTKPQIHAVGAVGTGLPKRTRLKLTLDVPALVRIRVKAISPYGLSRAFNVMLPAGSSAVPISARVDHTKMPPGGYKVVVKAHTADGSSTKKFLHLKIVG
jgi:hypothetical protein